MSSFSNIPLSDVEKQARNHALLCTIGFLIILPIGALIPRLTRTLKWKWFNAHWAFQFLIAGPIIFAGWVFGYRTTNALETPRFMDIHQKIGLTLLILYLIQLALGAIVHFFKLPSVFNGHRPAHSYLHAALGLTIFALAAYQVHYGLNTEWLLLGGVHKVPQSAKNAWLALIIVFWVLYVGALALLPRQFKQEQQTRKAQMKTYDNVPLNGSA